MELSDYFEEKRGRLTHMAAALGVAPGYLSQVAAGRKPLKPSYVPAAERISGGQVRRWSLRRDDWHLIWPELIGVEGAPVVPGEGQCAWAANDAESMDRAA